jgi:hypothetical protein
VTDRAKLLSGGLSRNPLANVAGYGNSGLLIVCATAPSNLYMPPIGKLRRWFELPPPKRVLLLQALTLVTGARVALKVLPFSVVRRALSKLATPPTASPAPAHLGEVIWAIETIGRQFPGVGTCLTQALAAHVLVGRSGHKSHLRIGVARSADGKFDAHAWLESDGVILIGSASHARYVPMPVLNGLDRPAAPRI